MTDSHSELSELTLTILVALPVEMFVNYEDIFPRVSLLLIWCLRMVGFQIGGLCYTPEPKTFLYKATRYLSAYFFTCVTVSFMSLLMISRFFSNNAVASFLMFFFRFLGKIEHLIDKWMFLITKDMQLIINSAFRRIIVSFQNCCYGSINSCWKSKALSREKQSKEREALRKKLRRVEMKLSNPEKNKARLLKERLYKREYRKRMKDQPSQFRIQLMKGSAKVLTYEVS